MRQLDLCGFKFVRAKWTLQICCQSCTATCISTPIKCYLQICKHRQIKKSKVGFGAGGWKFIKWCHGHLHSFEVCNETAVIISAFGLISWSRNDDKSWRTDLVKCHDHGTFEPAFVMNKLHSENMKVHFEKMQLRLRVHLPAFVFTPWCVRLRFLLNVNCVSTGFRMDSHIILYYIILYYIILYYITLHYITLHYITLHYITLYYIILYI